MRGGRLSRGVLGLLLGFLGFLLLVFIEEVQDEDLEGVLDDKHSDEEGSTHEEEEKLGVSVSDHDLIECML